MDQPENIIELEDRIVGVFRAQRDGSVGADDEQAPVFRDKRYYAEEDAEDEMCLQILNEDHLPTGRVLRMSREEFGALFSPDPEHYLKRTLPAMKALVKTIARAERMRMRGEPYSAELEFNNALNMDENNVRAIFGLGLTYIDQGRPDKAKEAANRLMALEETYDKKHKHRFNEFGIMLRKNKCYKQALKYYQGASKLAGMDDHLFYNMARTYYEMGDEGSAKKMLQKALEIDPAFHEANRFMEFLSKVKVERKKRPPKKQIDVD